jgi:GntR family transcriptional regulator/MocR family aminotransferase
MRSSPQQLLSMPASTGPLYLQIYHRIRNLILTGGWPPETQLPSSRSLAQDLGISRNTAILALDKLIADGWIQSRAGSGMFVTFEAPSARPAATFVANDAEELHAPIPFQTTYGAIDIFPVAEWAKVQSRVWTRSTDEALFEGAGAGWLPLRRAIAGFLHAVRGVVCSPDQILIMSSSRSAIDLAARVIGQPGDSIWVEDPGYGYNREAFQTDGLRQVPVPVDSEGMIVSVAKSLAADARLACVTPACQFPTCAILSAHRRSELLDWNRQTGSFIIEDDWDFNAVFDRQHPPEPLVVSAPESVLYIQSFNRLLFPALRIAALVVPASLAARFVDARLAVDGFPNMAIQIALTEFIERGLLSSYLRKCKLTYERRRNALHAGVNRYLSQWLRIDEYQAGLAGIAFTGGRSASEMAAVARGAGIACRSLDSFSFNANVSPEALVLGFGPFTSEMLGDATDRLSRVFADDL